MKHLTLHSCYTRLTVHCYWQVLLLQVDIHLDMSMRLPLLQFKDLYTQMIFTAVQTVQTHLES